MESNTIEYWKPIIEKVQTGKIKIDGNKPVNPQLEGILNVGAIYSGVWSHKEFTWKDLPHHEKIESCTHQSGKLQLSKLPNGHTQKQPIYCNLCENCYKVNALKLKGKIDEIDEKVREEVPNGQWRKKTVNDDTEAKSLKKRISRNQDGRHFEVACSNGTNDIYVYVEDEAGKDMDEIYGEPVDMDEVNYDEMYKNNRETGKRMSMGKSFKRKVTGKKKENTIKVSIPKIVIKDTNRQDEAEEIIERTNYLQLADTPEEARNLYNFQLKYIIQELKDANIEILAIDTKYYTFDQDQLLEDWNRNVTHWLSILASYTHDNEANMDNDDLIAHLHHKVTGEPEKLPN